MWKRCNGASVEERHQEDHMLDVVTDLSSLLNASDGGINMSASDIGERSKRSWARYGIRNGDDTYVIRNGDDELMGSVSFEQNGLANKDVLTLDLVLIEDKFKNNSSCKPLVTESVLVAKVKVDFNISNGFDLAFAAENFARGACFCYTKAMVQAGYSELRIRKPSPPNQCAVCTISDKAVINKLCEGSLSKMIEPELLKKLRHIRFFPSKEGKKLFKYTATDPVWDMC
eukprot:gnl/MRDRNA2_/MRDRNA2_192326_c0_seq1.p1 gnl/MRDRNA2_/MRDRNA2_192326_c0~~gnl/MRDRNA2_/MRDRNA2_192326_c0_seq1.p1  ORF type:complete len:229 (-),score=36.88 gnl/MRDRNA2_/MRDRNA2_192326_c0_seq1:55-741(-)